MSTPFFPASREAALARLAAVRPADYARSRNAIEGAVTRLSPYLSHGVLTLPDVHADIAARFALAPQHKLVYEFGWREYFHHVWRHRGDAIFASLHDGPLPETAYARELPPDLREGRTGVPAVDRAVAELYATGYLHNHGRMWLASYVVHLRKVHWRAGADWLYGHLLDGDLASNHLSWQWVAGTGSHKPYLFNAENVARYAPRDWHSPGTVVDRSYEALDRMARHPDAAAAAGIRLTDPALDEPPLLHAPPAHAGYAAPDARAVAGRDVWLIHPWALRAPPADLPEGTVTVAIAVAEWHARWPWSPGRWAFVAGLQDSLAAHCWYGDVASLHVALAGARSVHGVDDPHLGSELRQLRADGALRPTPRLFAPVERACASFSQWWHRTRLDA
ncbi:deoxyribodipyrimidine photolyase [Dyella ginsengisoli]|uniref:Deoxyribodipyrimidine photolyase n=1 Tax=Dyella ginsengisoli TaxID=363848 RepID=A0ABW8JWC6_9GAMM